MEKELLIQLIEISGLSQKQISERTSVPEPHISRWVKGVRNPKLSTIAEMAEKLGYIIEMKITKT